MTNDRYIEAVIGSADTVRVYDGCEIYVDNGMPSVRPNGRHHGELDRMTAALIKKHKIHTSGPMQGDGYFCTHCHEKNGIHKGDCPIQEAVMVREKYGFDR